MPIIHTVPPEEATGAVAIDLVLNAVKVEADAM